MPEPAEEWVEGRIPPARHWRVVYKYLGLADAVLHPNADACFAANAVCRRVYSRYPVDAAYHYRPLTKSDPRSLCADTDASGDAGGGSDHDALANPDASAGGGHTESRTGDSDGGSHADQLRADRCAEGREQGVFLVSGPAKSDVDPDPATVPDAGADPAVS